jgi:hypothetical protein
MEGYQATTLDEVIGTADIRQARREAHQADAGSGEVHRRAGRRPVQARSLPLLNVGRTGLEVRQS